MWNMLRILENAMIVHGMCWDPLRKNESNQCFLDTSQENDEKHWVYDMSIAQVLYSAMVVSFMVSIWLSVGGLAEPAPVSSVRLLGGCAGCRTTGRSVVTRLSRPGRPSAR